MGWKGLTGLNALSEPICGYVSGADLAEVEHLIGVHHNGRGFGIFPGDLRAEPIRTWDHFREMESAIGRGYHLSSLFIFVSELVFNAENDTAITQCCQRIQDDGNLFCDRVAVSVNDYTFYLTTLTAACEYDR